MAGLDQNELLMQQEFADSVANDVNSKFFDYCLHKYIDGTPYGGGFHLNLRPTSNVWKENGQYKVFNSNLDTGEKYILTVNEDGSSPRFEIRDKDNSVKSVAEIKHKMPYNDLRNIYTTYKLNLPELKHITEAENPTPGNDHLNFNFLINSGNSPKNLYYSWDKGRVYEVSTSRDNIPNSFRFERFVTSEELEAYTKPAEVSHELDSASAQSYSASDADDDDDDERQSEKDKLEIERAAIRTAVKQVIDKAEEELAKIPEFGTNPPIAISDNNFEPDRKESDFLIIATDKNGKDYNLNLTRTADGNVTLISPLPSFQAPQPPAIPQQSFEQLKQQADNDIYRKAENYFGEGQPFRIESSDFTSIDQPANYTVIWKDKEGQDFRYYYLRHPDGKVEAVYPNVPQQPPPLMQAQQPEPEIAPPPVQTAPLYPSQPRPEPAPPPAQATEPQPPLINDETRKHHNNTNRDILSYINKNIPGYKIAFTREELISPHAPAYFYAEVTNPDTGAVSNHCFTRMSDGRVYLDPPLQPLVQQEMPSPAPARAPDPVIEPSQQPAPRQQRAAPPPQPVAPRQKPPARQAPPKQEGLKINEAMDIAYNSIRSYFGEKAQIDFSANDGNAKNCYMLTYNVISNGSHISSTITVLPDGQSLMRNEVAKGSMPPQVAQPVEPPPHEQQTPHVKPGKIDLASALKTADSAIERTFTKSLVEYNAAGWEFNSKKNIYVLSYDVRLKDKTVLSTIEVSDTGKIKNLNHKTISTEVSEPEENPEFAKKPQPKSKPEPAPQPKPEPKVAAPKPTPAPPKEPEAQPPKESSGPKIRVPLGPTAAQCLKPMGTTYKNPNLIQYLTIWVEIRSSEVKQLLKEPEDAVFKSYICPAGARTIGFGSTGFSKETKEIDGNTASNWMNQHLVEHKQQFQKSFGNAEKVLSPHEYVALWSFSYNSGSISSNLGIKVKQYIKAKEDGDPELIEKLKDEICNKMKEYDNIKCSKDDKGSFPVKKKSGTIYYKESKGLVNRRVAEADLFIGEHEKFIEFFSEWKGLNKNDVRNKMAEEIREITPVAQKPEKDKSGTAMNNAPPNPAHEQYLREAKEILERITTQLNSPEAPDLWKIVQNLQQQTQATEISQTSRNL